MKTKVLKWITLVVKGIGLVSGLGAIPFIAPEKGVLVFLGASFVKDSLTRLGDILDDGKENQSFKV